MRLPASITPQKMISESIASNNSPIRARVVAILPLLIVTCAGLSTAFFRLDAKGLWGDEVWEVGWSHQQSLVETFLRFRSPPDLPLHFVLTRLATYFETNEFLTRLPAALLGAATVVLLFHMGRKVLGLGTGLLAALLLAVAPYHVWYSQDARPYAGLAFYSLLGFYCFYQLLNKPSIGYWIGFTVATTLNIYNHLFALFPILIEGGFLGIWAVVMLASNLRSRGQAGRQWLAGLLRSSGAILSGFIAAALLAWPLHEGISNYILQGGPGEIEAQPFELNINFISFIFGLLGAGAGWPIWVMGVLCVSGLIAGIYRRNLFVLLSLAWLSIPFIGLWLAQPRHIIIPRYFLFMQPIFLLMVAYGVMQLGYVLKHLAGSLRIAAPDRRWLISTTFSIVISILLLVTTLEPTWKIYWVEKINDWSGMCSYLRKNIQPDHVITGDVYYHGVMYWCFHILPGAPSTTIANPGEYTLAELASGERAIWYINIDPAAPNAQYVKQKYNEVPRSEWARRDLIVAFSDGERLLYPQGEQAATLYHKGKNTGQNLQPNDVNGPSKIKFNDEIGRYRNPSWPDFARIAPGKSYGVLLSLPAIAPRSLRITYLNMPSRDFEVRVNNKSLLKVSGGKAPGDWPTVEVALPPDISDSFQVEFYNPGAIAAAVSEVEVIYKGQQERVP